MKKVLSTLLSLALLLSLLAVGGTIIGASANSTDPYVNVINAVDASKATTNDGVSAKVAFYYDDDYTYYKVTVTDPNFDADGSQSAAELYVVGKPSLISEDNIPSTYTGSSWGTHWAQAIYSWHNSGVNRFAKLTAANGAATGAVRNTQVPDYAGAMAYFNFASNLAYFEDATTDAYGLTYKMPRIDGESQAWFRLCIKSSAGTYILASGGKEISSNGFTTGWNKYCTLDYAAATYSDGASTESTTYTVQFPYDDENVALGAQIRDTNNALRFGFSIEADGVSFADADTYERGDLTNAKMIIDGKLRTITDFGAMLCVKENATEEDLTVGTTSGSSAQIPAQKLYEIEDGVVTFLATLYNIPANMYDRGVSVRAYVEYVNEGGNTRYVYSDTIVRSVDDLLNAQ